MRGLKKNIWHRYLTHWVPTPLHWNFRKKVQKKWWQKNKLWSPRANPCGKHKTRSQFSGQYSFTKTSRCRPYFSASHLQVPTSTRRFYDITQLTEVYNMPKIPKEEIVKYFYLEGDQTLKLNINTDSIIHLSKHPYINWNLAKSIINYRKVHGNYDAVEQITSIKIISDSLYQKIAPYLTTSE